MANVAQHYPEALPSLSLNRVRSSPPGGVTTSPPDASVNSFGSNPQPVPLSLPVMNHNAAPVDLSVNSFAASSQSGGEKVQRAASAAVAPLNLVATQNLQTPPDNSQNISKTASSLSSQDSHHRNLELAKQKISEHFASISSPPTAMTRSASHPPIGGKRHLHNQRSHHHLSDPPSGPLPLIPVIPALISRPAIGFDIRSLVDAFGAWVGKGCG